MKSKLKEKIEPEKKEVTIERLQQKILMLEALLSVNSKNQNF